MKKGSRAHYALHKEKTRALVMTKVSYWMAHYARAGYAFAGGGEIGAVSKLKRVAIRNQRSRWGSCSKQGNLNFNYRLGLIPERLVDYVIVHELCHLGEFNHSKAFWDLVAQAIPDHHERRIELRDVERQLAASSATSTTVARMRRRRRPSFLSFLLK